MGIGRGNGLWLFYPMLGISKSVTAEKPKSLLNPLQYRVAKLPIVPCSTFRIFSGLSSGLRGAVHLVGSFVPLRGVASFMADIGVPGAITILELLTPTSTGVRY